MSLTDSPATGAGSAPGRPTRELRKFGIVMAAACGLLGGILWWHARGAWPYLAGAAGAFLFLAGIAPRVLAPVERVWMAMAEVLSAVMTQVVLTLSFILVVTPVGVIRRLVTKDPLGLRFDRSRGTYWVPVEPDGPGSRPDKPY